jgi:hypothetical protein
MSDEFQQKVEFNIDPKGAGMHVWVSPATIITFLMDPESLDRLCAEWAKVREQPAPTEQPESPYMMREEG